MLRLAATLALTLGLAAAAYADGDGPPPSTVPPEDYWQIHHVHRAPEIAASGAIAGLTLLAGGLAVLRRRRGGK
jgi:hypothetical protein